MITYKNISQDSLVSALLLLSDEMISFLRNYNGYSYAVETLEICWNWHKNKNVSAGELYNRLENSSGISVSDYLEMEDDKFRESIWHSLVDVLVFITYLSYESDSSLYLPQSIESLSEETFSHFFEMLSYIFCETFSDGMLTYLQTNYPVCNEKKVDENSMREFIKNNSGVSGT